MNRRIWKHLRLLFGVGLILTTGLSVMGAASGQTPDGDPPIPPSEFFPVKWLPAPEQFDFNNQVGAGGPFSKTQIERFRCESSGNPAAAVDISCNTDEFGQDLAPDNEIAIAVDPTDPDHMVAGSNDYFYRFNNATGARQAIVPTGFFTSFDGGETWLDGQIPMRSGNGAGDPSPAFDAAHEVALMAQLENVAGAGGLFTGEAPNYDPCDAGPGSDTDVYKVESHDGGATWGARTFVEDTNGPAWFPWADCKSDGTLVVAWDQDDGPAPADNFSHVLKVGGPSAVSFGPTEHPDLSLTHWAGQYVAEDEWPAICGPAGSSTEGKGCNIFHGDYTRLAVGPDDSINVVWTGLNAFETSPQIDFYTGDPWQGYRQGAMFARR